VAIIANCSICGFISGVEAKWLWNYQPTTLRGITKHEIQQSSVSSSNFTGLWLSHRSYIL